MANKNSTYRIYYIADNYTTGLTDVTVTIILPNGMLAGSFTMTELSARPGVYIYDYVLLYVGQYYFEKDSISTPNKDVEIVDVFNNIGAPYADFT